MVSDQVSSIAWFGIEYRWSEIEYYITYLYESGQNLIDTAERIKFDLVPL